MEHSTDLARVTNGHYAVPMLTIQKLMRTCGGSVAMARHYATLPNSHKRPLTASAIRYWVVRGSGIPHRHYGWVAALAGVSITDVHAANEALWAEFDLRQAS